MDPNLQRLPEKVQLVFCRPDYFSAQAHRRFRRWALCFNRGVSHPASRVQMASRSASGLKQYHRKLLVGLRFFSFKRRRPDDFGSRLR